MKNNKSDILEKGRSFLCSTILVIFICCIGWAFFSSLFHGSLIHGETMDFFVPVNKFFIFLGALFFVILLYFLYTFLKRKKFTSKQLWIFSILLLFLFVLCQAFTSYLVVNPSWDFGNVFQGASLYVNGEKTVYIWRYLSEFPNNIPLFLVEIFVFKLASLFGIANFLKVGICMNVVFIDLAVLFLFLYLKKNHSFEIAIMGLVCCILLSPMFLYTPIFYTDTFSVFYPIFILYCYSFIRKEKITKKNWYFAMLMGFATIIGMKMKMTVIITAIAIFIDCILQNSWKENWKVFVIFAFSFGIGSIFCNQAYEWIDSKYQFEESLKIPYNQWIKMGMHRYGGYTEEDYTMYDYVTDYDEREKMNYDNIKQTLSDYGFWGYLQFLNNKVFYTWGDGTYTVNIKLTRKPLDTENFMADIFQTTGKYYMEYLYYVNFVHYGILLLLLISAIFALLKKEQKSIPLFLSIIGIFLFFLFWETRSRYLYNYIPVFICAAIPVLQTVYSRRKQI